jgi:hypothetical protein
MIVILVCMVSNCTLCAVYAAEIVDVCFHLAVLSLIGMMSCLQPLVFQGVLRSSSLQRYIISTFYGLWFCVCGHVINAGFI